MNELRRFLERTVYKGRDLDRRFRAVGLGLLERSPVIDRPDFVRTEWRDLERLFELYDGLYFGGRLRGALGGRELELSYSRRLTSSGGRTLHWWGGGGHAGDERFAIRVSIHLLFRNFNGDGHRQAQIGGCVCETRLEALQRIFEHELVHLAELLAWGESRCSRPRFAGILHRLFGQTETRHALVTVAEDAAVSRDIRQGDRVRFRYDGRVREGVVNRITKRATVLVEDPRGARYSDGWTYAKYYVPLPAMEKL